MRNEDFAQFNDLLEATYALLGRDKMPNATAKALFFRALQHLSFDEVRAGFDAHIKDPTRGRFAPMPADIIAASEGVAANDSRPGAEQAWAMCCRAADEYETVVWTSEMAEAFAAAAPCAQEGDRIGARMAFKESYIQLVNEARRERRPIQWQVSLGQDPTRRHAALEAAEMQGLLPPGEALKLAPPVAKLENSARLLLENAQAAPDPQKVRERVAAIKAMLKKEPEE